MSKTQAVGVGLFLWLLGIIALTNSGASNFELALFLVMFLIAYALIIWEEKK